MGNVYTISMCTSTLYDTNVIINCLIGVIVLTLRAGDNITLISVTGGLQTNILKLTFCTSHTQPLSLRSKCKQYFVSHQDNVSDWISMSTCRVVGLVV